MIVAGTRAAMFAPVRDLGLVVLWDDGDDLHAEPHAPYPNAREVLRCSAAPTLSDSRLAHRQTGRESRQARVRSK